MKKFINISPHKGLLKGKDDVEKIKIVIIPAFPFEINEYIILQVAHFEPERINIKGNGVFSSLRMDVPMVYEENLGFYFEKKKKIPAN